MISHYSPTSTPAQLTESKESVQLERALDTVSGWLAADKQVEFNGSIAGIGGGTC